MKLDKTRFFAHLGEPMWRITGGLIWGPFCYSRRDAIWQWVRCNVCYFFRK